MAFEDGEESVVLCQLSLYGKAEGLSDLIAVSLELEVPLQPLIDAPEEPAQLAQFIDQLASSRGHNCLGREDVGVLELGKLDVLPLDALKDKEEVPHDQVLIYWLLVP